MTGNKRQKAAEMWAEGKSKAEIAAALGVSDRTVRNWLSGSGSGKENSGPVVEPVDVPRVASSSGSSGSSGNTSGKAKTSDLEDLFTEGAGLISVLIAMWICRDLPPVEAKDEMIDALSMTPQEAKAIGKPIAGIFQRSGLAKYGGKVVEAGQWKELILALASYGGRIYPYLRGNIRVEFVREAQPVQNSGSNGHSAAASAAAASAGGSGSGPVPFVIPPQAAA